MILEFNKPFSLDLKEELFKQTFENQANQAEYGKLLRTLHALGWLEEYKDFEVELNDSNKRRFISDNI